MYTHHRISEHLKRTTKGPKFLTSKKISKKEKTGEIPMKALLRSSVVVLVLFGCYSAFSLDASTSKLAAPQLPGPCLPPQ